MGNSCLILQNQRWTAAIQTQKLFALQDDKR